MDKRRASTCVDPVQIFRSHIESSCHYPRCIRSREIQDIGVTEFQVQTAKAQAHRLTWISREMYRICQERDAELGDFTSHGERVATSAGLGKCDRICFGCRVFLGALLLQKWVVAPAWQKDVY